MDKKLERANKDKVLRHVAKRLSELGFNRSKPTFFTRMSGPVVEFVHLHKFTFAAEFRAHLGIRIVNESSAAVGLNGPSSDEIADENTQKRKYNFSYAESTESVNGCGEKIFAFIMEFAEPWFERWDERPILVTASDSPLHSEGKTALQSALIGRYESCDTVVTKELLGIP
jgi:hypothetical protein